MINFIVIFVYQGMRNKSQESKGLIVTGIMITIVSYIHIYFCDHRRHLSLKFTIP